MTSQHATRDPTTQQQGWRSDQVLPWRLDHTPGSRQDIHSTRTGAGYDQEAVDGPTTTTCDTKKHCADSANSNMVAELTTRMSANMVAEPSSDVRPG